MDRVRSAFLLAMHSCKPSLRRSFGAGLALIAKARAFRHPASELLLQRKSAPSGLLRCLCRLNLTPLCPARHALLD